MDINMHTIQGRLGDDPKISRTARGAFARLRVVTNYSYTSPTTGELIKKTTGHTVIVIGDDVESLVGARKGDGLFVVGYPEDHEFTDGSGKRRSERQLVAQSISRPLQVLPANNGTDAPQSRSRPVQQPERTGNQAPRNEPPARTYQNNQSRHMPSSYADPADDAGHDPVAHQPQQARGYPQRPASDSSAQRGSFERNDRQQAPVAQVARQQAVRNELPPIQDFDEFAEMDSQLMGDSYVSGR